MPKCISVYTKKFETFSDIYDQVMSTKLKEDEEATIEGITISESGDVPEHYLNRMKSRPEVVVMRIKDQNITILQHGDVFEIFIPDQESMVH